jgi:hypothetical protein
MGTATTSIEAVEDNEAAGRRAARQTYRDLLDRADKPGPRDAGELQRVLSILGLTTADARRHLDARRRVVELLDGVTTSADLKALREAAEDVKQSAAALLRKYVKQAVDELSDADVFRVVPVLLNQQPNRGPDRSTLSYDQLIRCACEPVARGEEAIDGAIRWAAMAASEVRSLREQNEIAFGPGEAEVPADVDAVSRARPFRALPQIPASSSLGSFTPAPGADGYGRPSPPLEPMPAPMAPPDGLRPVGV